MLIGVCVPASISLSVPTLIPPVALIVPIPTGRERPMSLVRWLLIEPPIPAKFCQVPNHITFVTSSRFRPAVTLVATLVAVVAEDATGMASHVGLSVRRRLIRRRSRPLVPHGDLILGNCNLEFPNLFRKLSDLRCLGRL